VAATIRARVCPVAVALRVISYLRGDMSGNFHG
jgi:hypothetical protein